MRRRRLDPETAERLLKGAVAPEDAPPGYAGVAAVLGGARAFGAVDDLLETETIAEIAAVVRSHQPAIPLTPRSRFMSSRNHSAKVAVGVFAGVLSIAGVAAAAAGGHLPDAAQDAVSHAASHAGISLPNSDNQGKAHNGVTSTIHSNVTPPACGDESTHGEYVSSVAQNTPTGTIHGATVSAAAKSDCGKSGGNGPSVTSTEHSSVSNHSSTHKSSEGESNSEGAGPAITATEHASDSGVGDAATTHSSDGLLHRP